MIFVFTKRRISVEMYIGVNEFNYHVIIYYMEYVHLLQVLGNIYVSIFILQ